MKLSLSVSYIQVEKIEVYMLSILTSTLEACALPVSRPGRFTYDE
jgi:hypothetical protein